MTTKAQNVCKVWHDHTFTACTFLYGYGTTEDGRTIQFDKPVSHKETRRNGGRAIKCRYVYDDGSALLYGWSEVTGSVVQVDEVPLCGWPKPNPEHCSCESLGECGCGFGQCAKGLIY